MSQRGVDQVVKRTPFRIGTKRVFLPNFKVTLLRTPSLPPNYATFQVPLALNKLDFRDYLLHAYNIRTIAITSRVQNVPVVETGNPKIARPQMQKLFRPAPIKKMTVLMEQPFVWPPPPPKPELDDKWNAATFQSARKEGEDMQKAREQGFVDERDRKSMAQQAKDLLAGKVRWKPQSRAEGNWAVSRSGADGDGAD